MSTTAKPALWQLAFPHFPADAVPPIPAGWQDISWKNDACPRFHAAGDTWGTSLSVWIDHPNASARECGADMPRYIGEWSDGYGALRRTFYQGDDWGQLLATVTVERLAWELSAGLMRDLTAQQWQDMRAANVGIAAGVCASHDYIDANETMADAFERIMGRPVALANDTAAGDAQADLDASIWSAAWTIATPEYLTAKSGAGAFDPADAFAAWRLTGNDHASMKAAGAPDVETDGPGRSYGPGYIERVPGGWHVLVGALTEIFEHLPDAERMLWECYASSEWRHG